MATVSLWKQVAKQIKEKYGVTKFSGQRITGARRKFGVVADKAFITRDTEQFNVSEYNESDAVEYSVSDKLLSDKEIQNSQLPSNVKAKLFYETHKKHLHQKNIKLNIFIHKNYKFGLFLIGYDGQLKKKYPVNIKKKCL